MISDETNDQELDDVILDLEPIRNFMEEYIGMLIHSIDSFRDSYEMEDDVAECTIISSLLVDKNKIKINLSSISGVPAGTLTLSPSMKGHFAERSNSDSPIWSSIYRINFVGGNSIEYLDPSKDESLLYIEFDE